MRAECEATGFLALTGHGISRAQLAALFAAARPLFDRPLAEKQAWVVNDMRSGRGYEISPEHKEFMAAFAGARRGGGGGGGGSSSSAGGDGAAAPAAAAAAAAAEPSAIEGILSERFLCGPPLSGAQLADPYYSEGLGPVFFAPDAWPPPGAAPVLRARMQACHGDMGRVADAALRLVAAALGLEASYFDGMVARACSNLQVCA